MVHMGTARPPRGREASGPYSDCHGARGNGSAPTHSVSSSAGSCLASGAGTVQASRNSRMVCLSGFSVTARQPLCCRRTGSGNVSLRSQDATCGALAATRPDGVVKDPPTHGPARQETVAPPVPSPGGQQDGRRRVEHMASSTSLSRNRRTAPVTTTGVLLILATSRRQCRTNTKWFRAEG